MFFRVRATLTERPGALAALATRCGEHGLNILGLQIFPGLGRVTDELVLGVPEDWTAGAVAELVSGAGGDEVSVGPCTTHDLIDQPTRWLTAAQGVVADPDSLPAELDRLLGPSPEKWTPTEHSRAAALSALAGPPEDSVAPTGSGPVEYAETLSGVVAHIGGHAVGAATLSHTAEREVTIEVAPAWRRQGIGTALLQRAAMQAVDAGVEEILLLADADDEGFVTLVCNAGLGARIKVTDGLLQARIGVGGVRRTARSRAETDR